jgi:hypothetical protein
MIPRMEEETQSRKYVVLKVMAPLLWTDRKLPYTFRGHGRRVLYANFQKISKTEIMIQSRDMFILQSKVFACVHRSLPNLQNL